MRGYRVGGPLVSRWTSRVAVKARVRSSRPMTCAKTGCGSRTRSWPSSSPTWTTVVTRVVRSRMDYAVLDTNVASLSVKGEMPASLNVRLMGFTPLVTFITVGELNKWAEMRSWGQRRRGALDHWLSQRPIIHSNEDVSRLWGQVAAAAERRG